MLPQEVFTVIVAVGRSYNDVDMIFVGFGMFSEGDAALMVEFDDDHRTLHAVIKCAVVIHAAHPAEMSILQMTLHLRHFNLRMSVANPTHMVFDQVEQKVVL